MLSSCLPPKSFTAATDPGVEVVARFQEDLDAARTWVWSVLGDLAADNEADDRLDVEVALLLAGWFGAAVLA